MNKNKKNVVYEHIDIKKVIEDSKQKLSKVLDDFNKYLSSIVPNEMNLEIICQTIIVEGKALKKYDNSDILISKQTTRSLKIEKGDKPTSSKIFQGAGKSLTQAGYIVNEKDGSIIAKLPEFLGEQRTKIIKDLKAEKEKIKLLINKHRKDFMDLIKNKVSENEEKNATKQFEKIKDDVMKALEKAFSQKVTQVQG